MSIQLYLEHRAFVPRDSLETAVCKLPNAAHVTSLYATSVHERDPLLRSRLHDYHLLHLPTLPSERLTENNLATVLETSLKGAPGWTVHLGGNQVQPDPKKRYMVTCVPWRGRKHFRIPGRFIEAHTPDRKLSIGHGQSVILTIGPLHGLVAPGGASELECQQALRSMIFGMRWNTLLIIASDCAANSATSPSIRFYRDSVLYTPPSKDPILRLFM